MSTCHLPAHPIITRIFHHLGAATAPLKQNSIPAPPSRAPDVPHLPPPERHRFHHIYTMLTQASTAPAAITQLTTQLWSFPVATWSAQLIHAVWHAFATRVMYVPWFQWHVQMVTRVKEDRFKERMDGMATATSTSTSAPASYAHIRLGVHYYIAFMDAMIAEFKVRVMSCRVMCVRFRVGMSMLKVMGVAHA